MLALAALAAAVVVTVVTPRGESRTFPVASSSVVTPAPDPVATLLVHVTGCVARPGLYELNEGARVLDAVSAAGGFTPQAERSGVNLARKVADGEQLHIPAVGEVAPSPAGAPSAGGVLNLNTASEAELESLPRVGPAMAARIVAWREKNGPFRSVDELLEVSGIGEKTLDGLRGSVTV